LVDTGKSKQLVPQKKPSGNHCDTVSALTQALGSHKSHSN
jgi:hypothetical protein